MAGAARRGVHGRPGLEAAHGDDVLSLPDLEGEGAGSPAEDGVGAVIEGVERGNHATGPDPDEAGAEEISRELARQLATRIVLEQGKKQEHPKISENLLKLCHQEFHLLSKIHLEKQLEHQKLPQSGKTSVFLRLCMEAEEYRRDLLTLTSPRRW
jgi:hypothetical protein